ncbi:MAG: hypothetical protein IJC77_00600 [Bacteroidaceae bacterium]|nr:hypothetical protein [Bacteroidaceae bacterium]
MKAYKSILFIFALFAFFSCFKDESTDAINPISEITIDESNLEKVYNISKNDTLRITPKVTQTDDELQLSYAWELNQEIVSTEKTFCYVGKTLGTFNGRLIVENEDGKAFYIFTLNVNSPYEYGITVLSKDADNRPHIAFMQDPMTEGDSAKFYEENCLEKNNREQFFSSNPSDMIQTTGSLIIACQGDETKTDDEPTIYFLNEKTFVMENLVVGSEYESFKPTKLLIPYYNSFGISYPVLSADGKMYSLPTSNAVLQPSTQFTSTYAQTAFVKSVSASSCDIIAWDNDINGLLVLYNGYGPYYCGQKYLLQRDSVLTDTYYKQYFESLKAVRTLTCINKTAKQLSQSRSELIAIVQAPLQLQKAIISTFFWRRIEGTVSSYEVLDNGKGFSKVGSRSYSLINENTPCIANATYETMLFANGNKIMRWYYNKDNHYLEDADELLTVGSDDAIITSFEISDDHMKTYVAFYEPNQEGKNGSVWVFETNTGKVLEQYDNVCYQPVKMIYKKK